MSLKTGNMHAMPMSSPDSTPVLSVGGLIGPNGKLRDEMKGGLLGRKSTLCFHLDAKQLSCWMGPEGNFPIPVFEIKFQSVGD